MELVPVIPLETCESTEVTNVTLFKFDILPFEQKHTPHNQSKTGEHKSSKMESPGQNCTIQSIDIKDHIPLQNRKARTWDRNSMNPS